MITQKSHLTAQVHKANGCQHGRKVKGKSLPCPDPTLWAVAADSACPLGEGWVSDWLAQCWLLFPTWTPLHTLLAQCSATPVSKSVQTGLSQSLFLYMDGLVHAQLWCGLTEPAAISRCITMAVLSLFTGGQAPVPFVLYSYTVFSHV